MRRILPVVSYVLPVGAGTLAGVEDGRRVLRGKRESGEEQPEAHLFHHSAGPC